MYHRAVVLGYSIDTAARIRRESDDRSGACRAHALRFVVPAHPQNTMVFTDSEETSFYSRCVKKFLLDARSAPAPEITEFGSGEAVTMARYLARSRYPGVIRGYEINRESYLRARKSIQDAGVSTRYIVKHANFFATRHDRRGALIVNPPYLPAPAPRLAMPELWGGRDGTRVVKRLIDLGFDQLLMLVASISDPIGVIRHARRRSYRVVDFLVITLPFGKYTLEPIVFHQFQRMASRGKALVRSTAYQVAAVHFRKHADGVPDRSQRLLDQMTRWCGHERPVEGRPPRGGGRRRSGLRTRGS